MLHIQSDKGINDIDIMMSIHTAKSNHWSLKLDLFQNVFSSQQKMVSEGAVLMATERLFHVGEVATGNEQSPKIDCSMGKTMSVVTLEEMMQRQLH